MAENLGSKYLAYPSIEGELRKGKLSEYVWIATEKIDGSNLSIRVEKRLSPSSQPSYDLIVGTRNRELKGDEDFNGHKALIEKYRSSIIAVSEAVRKKYLDAKTVILYAEIYGGHYKHPDVPKPKCKWVLNRVSYSNVIDLAFYDIRLDIKTFLPFEEGRALFEEAKLPLPPILFSIKIGEDIPDIEKIESQVYLRHKLPKIEKNYIEGAVLRSGRFRLKRKRNEFAEKERSHNSKNEENNDDGELAPPDPAPYVTESRLYSAYSKLAGPTKDTLWTEFFRDIVKAYFEDHVDVAGKAKSAVRRKTGELVDIMIEKKWPELEKK